MPPQNFAYEITIIYPEIKIVGKVAITAFILFA
jgi:hypothetical protein